MTTLLQRSRALLAAFALVLALTGCAAIDRTEMIVLVDTNLPVASQMGTPALAGQIRSISFQVECLAEMGDAPCRLRDRDMATFTGLEQSYEQSGLGTRPPFYFVLRRDVPGLRRTFRVTATALVGPAGAGEQTIVVTASAATTEGEAHVLVLALREECLDATCATGTTCTLGGGCAPVAEAAPSWPGDCASVARPGLATRECTDNLFTP